MLMENMLNSSHQIANMIYKRNIIYSMYKLLYNMYKLIYSIYKYNI